MSKRILITGASGLIGTQLTHLLLSRNHEAAHLGRIKKESHIPSFVWNVEKREFDHRALENTDTIIHLAGTNVGEKRWTSSRKNEILNSRVDSTSLLFEALKEAKHSVKTFIAASAIGYYGFEGNSVFTEVSPPGNDFLAGVTKQWEDEVDKIESLGIRLVKIRIGIVLSKNGGALKQMATPIKYGVGSPLGSGQQYLSWIHLDDLCELFLKSGEDEKMNGAYNAAASWATNSEMTRAIAKILKRKCWLPNVPAFVLKIALGEMADIVLNGSKISSEKAIQAGFKFKYENLEEALHNIYRKSELF